MTTLTILIVLLIICLIGYKMGWNYELYTILCITLCLLMFLYATMGLRFYTQSLTRLQEYKAIQATIEEARKDSNSAERIAYALKITEINQEIAIVKYWNEGEWDWFYSDEFANLPYLK
jgi:hypothetical protein